MRGPYFSSDQEGGTTSGEPHGEPCPFGLALLKASGGNSAIIAAMRREAWAAYVDENAPYGATEWGLSLWFTEQMRRTLEVG